MRKVLLSTVAAVGLLISGAAFATGSNNATGGAASGGNARSGNAIGGASLGLNVSPTVGVGRGNTSSSNSGNQTQTNSGTSVAKGGSAFGGSAFNLVGGWVH